MKPRGFIQTSDEVDFVRRQSVFLIGATGSPGFSVFGDEVPHGRGTCSACSTALGPSLSGGAQGTEPPVHQVEKPLQRISRTQFDVDTPAHVSGRRDVGRIPRFAGPRTASS